MSIFIDNPFMQNAIIVCFFCSVVCAVIGVMINEKKLLMMGGGIAHTAYGGVGLGYYLGFEPILGAIIFAIASAFGIGYIQKKGKINSDTVIGLIWSLGMALGILFFTMSKGYKSSLESYLFGNVLSVVKNQIVIIAVLSAIVVITAIVFYEDWKSFLFDNEFAMINGLNVTFFEYYMLVLIALSIVALIHVVGIILVMAMLTAPAASSALITKKFGLRMILAGIIGFINCVIGLIISYYLNVASGASIVVISIILYSIILSISKVIKILKRK